MSVFDRVVGIVAPHMCMACGAEGTVLCRSCVELYWQPPASICAGCFKLQPNARVCRQCRSWLPLKTIYIAATYDGVGEQLVQACKFELKRQAAVAMAEMISQTLPGGLESVTVCPVPTAPSRIRQRGFDHVKLVARRLGRDKGIEYKSLLERSSNKRQLGASRSKRIEQMSREFTAKRTNEMPHTVLLIDDVMTSGATLAAAAKTLKKAGVSEVYGAVFARQT